MPFDPLRATGMLYADTGEADPAFLGSCFSLRDTTTVLTAAHCVAGHAHADLYVKPGWAIIVGEVGEPPPIGFSVAEVIPHPVADVALVRLEDARWGFEPFWNALPIHGLGEDLYAYGYPENVRSDERAPTARLFKGYVQRVFQQDSHMGYRYAALELDFACPAGLSGGPLFRPAAPQIVLGVATENFESTTFLDAVEETTGSGETRRTQYQRVLSYGVAASLASLDDWLNEYLPRVDPAS